MTVRAPVACARICGRALLPGEPVERANVPAVREAQESLALTEPAGGRVRSAEPAAGGRRPATLHVLELAVLGQPGGAELPADAGLPASPHSAPGTYG